MDYRELNQYVDVHTADADVCMQKLREWRQEGSDIAVLDLHSAYLQIHVDKSLWRFQTVQIDGQGYYLTRLDLGLNMSPLLIQSIVNAVVAQDSYIDDIFVNESIYIAARVRMHLQ